MDPNKSEEKPLTDEEKSLFREKAKKVLQELEETAKASSPSSWVREDADSAWLQGRSNRCRYFDTHGFLVVPKFLDSKTSQALKDQMEYLANNDWDPAKSLDTFATNTEGNTTRGDYFLDSSNKVHYFAEPHALDEQKQLKPEFQRDKLSALNKAGHGMHTIPGAFRDYTLSSNMRELVAELGWKDPVVPQSMYIFKQPKIGGTVNSHQDSSFLYTTKGDGTPRQTCLGLWLALDDATLENGCLWARPGSHQEPLRRQFIRNPDYLKTNDPAAPKLVFKSHHDNEKVTWEGGLPNSLLKKGFLPIEVKAGDLVTFCGTLDHLSLPNFSDLQRHTFQLHLVEGPKEDIVWSPCNWLQYPSGVSFLSLTPS